MLFYEQDIHFIGELTWPWRGVLYLPFLIVQQGERKHKAFSSATEQRDIQYYHIHHTHLHLTDSNQHCLIDIINLTFIDLVNSSISCLYIVCVCVGWRKWWCWEKRREDEKAKNCLSPETKFHNKNKNAVFSFPLFFAVNLWVCVWPSWWKCQKCQNTAVHTIQSLRLWQCIFGQGTP